MPLHFTPGAGTVTRVLSEKEDTIFKIAFSGGAALTLPVTGFAIEQSGNYQFLNTVNNFIYVYSFGDRISEMTVSGLGFVKTCNAEETKINNIFTFYNTNKISRGLQLSVTLGDANEAFYAFLTGMRCELQDPMTMIGQWSLRFHVVPKK